MNAEQQTVVWGILVTLPFLVNMWLRPRSDAVGLAGMVVIIWVIDRVVWALLPTEIDRAATDAIIDLIAGAVAMSVWTNRHRWWKLALAWFYVGQLVLHFDYILAFPTGPRVTTYNYIVLNNALLVGQLLCVLYPGVRDGVGRLARLAYGSLPHRARHVHYTEP